MQAIYIFTLEKAHQFMLCLSLLFFSCLVLADNDQTIKIYEFSISSNDANWLVSIDKIELSNTIVFENISYSCGSDNTIYPIHNCLASVLQFEYLGGKYQYIADIYYDTRVSKWSVTAYTKDRKHVVSINSKTPEQIRVKLEEMNIGQFISLLNLNFTNMIPTGKLNGEISINTSNGTIHTKDLVVSELNYEFNDDYIIADLSVKLDTKLDYINKSVSDIGLSIIKGEALFDQFYMDFSLLPLNISGIIGSLDKRKIVADIDLSSGDVFDSKVSVILDNNNVLEQLVLEFDVFRLDDFNEKFLFSFLELYAMTDTQMSGQLKGSLKMVGGKLDQYNIEIEELKLINKKRKLMVEDLNGVINWQTSNDVEKSYLQWYGLLLEGMPIRQSGIEFKFFDEFLTIIGQPRLPVFDGNIELKQLHLQNIFSNEIDAQVEMLINPISLQLITEKLGWPEMHGQISGSIPSMVKKGSVINFLGGLDIQVFDGHLEVKNLSLERLFGVAPVIASDIVFTGFDLEKLTETYGFGKITGKLSGTVEKLRITNWETDRLAANIYTVKDKSVKQLISQQALDHISSLGGIQGAVSKSFLKFFNDFKYKKIAFSCVLHDSVCRIGGINNTEDQFVLVEGGGLPRINIVGFTRNIDWSEFINRLLYAEYTD